MQTLVHTLTQTKSREREKDTHTQRQTQRQTHTQTDALTQTHTYIYIYMHTCMHTYIPLLVPKYLKNWKNWKVLCCSESKFMSNFVLWFEQSERSCGRTLDGTIFRECDWLRCSMERFSVGTIDRDVSNLFLNDQIQDFRSIFYAIRWCKWLVQVRYIGESIGRPTKTIFLSRDWG